jgi:hypothetical protein
LQNAQPNTRGSPSIRHASAAAQCDPGAIHPQFTRL